MSRSGSSPTGHWGYAPPAESFNSRASSSNLLKFRVRRRFRGKCAIPASLIPESSIVELLNVVSRNDTTQARHMQYVAFLNVSEPKYIAVTVHRNIRLFIKNTNMNILILLRAEHVTYYEFRFNRDCSPREVEQRIGFCAHIRHVQRQMCKKSHEYGLHA